MSQVRKFKDGGSNTAETTSKSKHNSKYGHYIVDGTTYDVNDDFIRDYIASAKQFNDNSTNTVASHVVNALKSGQDVSLDTLNNRIYGINDYLNSEDVERSNEYSQNSLNRKYQRKYRRKEARPNSSLHQLNIGISNLGSIQFTEPTPESDKETLVKPSLFGSYNWFDYNDNEDGTKYYSTAPINATNERILDQYADLYNLTPEQAREKYDLDENKYNQFLDWKNKFGAQFMGENNDGFTQLLNRIKNQQVTQEDKDLLSLLGFTYSKPTPTSTTTSRSYEGSGFNNDALEQAGYYVVKDKDGNVYLHDNSGNVVQDKIYLRDTPWAKGTQWSGGAVYKGRLWTPEQIFNQNTEVSRVIGSELFNQLSSAQDPESIRQAMINSEWSVYGMNNPINYNTFDSSKNYLKGFMDSLNNGTYYWNDITGNYQLRDGDDTRILQVINGNDRDRDNTLRTKYAVSGYSGLFNTIEELQNYLNTRGIKQAQGYHTYSPLSQYSYIINNGKQYIVAPEQIDIAGEKYNLYRDEQGQYYTDGNNGKMKLLQGKAILDKIANGTVSAQELKNGFAQEDNRSGIGNDGRFFGINVRTKNKNPYIVSSYDQIFGFKKGGLIPIFQMGGFFTTGNVGKNKEGTQTDNRAGQPQKLGVDKRLKTDTDSLNKTAGWLDAAGLATSWIPGVGTGIGILGSLARFGADVSKDGFQWKDAGNLAINLGLDALTLIPGLGAVGKVAKAGSKAAKLAKTSDKVAKVAKSVTPILSAAGATTGAAQIYGALNNPEGMTSEDFGNLLSGIANVGLGSKNLVKNYKVAKVAKKLSGSKPVKTKDVFKINEKDKWLKRNAKKVGNFGNKAIHAPGNLVKNNGSTLNWMFNPWKQSQIDALVAKNWKTLAKSKDGFAQSLAAEFLVKNPIKSAKNRTIDNKIYRGTQIGEFPWRNPKYELNFRNKSKSKTGTKKPELPKQGDEIQHLLDEINLLYGKEANAARTWDTWKGDNYALYPYLAFKKGGKIVKGQNGLKPGDLVYNNTSSPSYFDYNRSGIKFNGSNVDWTATYDPNNLYSKYRNVYLNNWDNPEFNVYKQAYLNQLSQGNSNIDVNNLSKDEFARITNDGLLGYAHNLYVDPNGDNGLYNLAMNQLPAATVTAKSNIKPIPQGKAVAQSSLGLIPNPALSNNQVVEETKQSTQKSSGAGSQYTNANSVLKNLNFNPDDLFGLIETTRSVIANNQLYKDLKEANTAVLKPYMPEIYDRYQDHITPIYQEAAKAKRNFIPTSTDSTVNYAMRQANEDTAQQLETEGRLKASEQYSQYLDKDLAARRAYAEDRRNTAFYNTQEMANKVMRDAQIEQGRKLANNQSISNYVMEMRNKFAQDRARSQAFQKQQDALLAQQALNAEVNKAAQKWRTIFANMDPEERKARSYDSYEDIWLEQDPESYNNAYITGQLKAQQYLQDNQNKYIDYLFNKVPYVNLLANYKTPVSMPAYMSSFKSGGKTRKYTQRHTGQKPDEAIWIQRNKDTAKALEKLHDAVIKLFMKSIS